MVEKAGGASREAPAEKGLIPALHILGGIPAEGEGQDPLRRDAFFHQPGDPGGQHGGLAGTGNRQQEDVVLPGKHGLPLLRAQGDALLPFQIGKQLRS